MFVFIRQTSVKFARLYHLYLQLYNQNNVLAKVFELNECVTICEFEYEVLAHINTYFFEFYLLYVEGRCFIFVKAALLSHFFFAFTFYIFYLLYVAQIEPKTI